MSKGKKISKGEKLAIVKRCLSGELGVREAGWQVGVNQQSIREWVNRYEAEALQLSVGGIEGLPTTHTWSPEVRKFLFYFTVYLTGSSSYSATAPLSSF